MWTFDAGTRQSVTHLRFRPDGGGLTAAFRRSGELGTWDLAAGTFAREERFPVRRVTCFDYSPDGSVVAVGGDDGGARLYARPGGGVLAELHVGRGEGWGNEWSDRTAVHAVAFAPGADPRRRWVAAGGVELQLRNLTTHEVVAAFDPGYFRAVAFDPDGESVYAADAVRPEVVRWGVKPLRLLFRARSDWAVTRLVVAPNGETVAAADGGAVWLLAADGRTRARVVVAQEVADLALTPDGRLLAVADKSRSVKLIDPHVGAVVREYDWGVGRVSAVAVSPDGTMAAAGGEKGQVVVWDLDG